MKKIKSIPVYLLLFMLCSIFVVSCSEDSPVTPPDQPYQFDSARYDYKVIRLQGIWYFTGELWAQDTSQIFIVNPFHGGFVHILNGTPNYYHDPSFSPASVSGISNSEVYLSGLLKKRIKFYRE